MDIYSAADKSIQRMNRRNIRAFDGLRLMKHDELNIIREVSSVYDESAKRARTQYFEIAFDAYIIALIEARIRNREATEWADIYITLGWVDDILEGTDPVTMYKFTTETERKKQRLMEALSVSERWNDEIDKALRYWTLQIGQYAINVVDRARLDAFKRAGIKKVKWITEKDERVCETCDELDEKVFDIDDVPAKPHINCRCRLRPVFDRES